MPEYTTIQISKDVRKMLSHTKNVNNLDSYDSTIRLMYKKIKKDKWKHFKKFLGVE